MSNQKSNYQKPIVIAEIGCNHMGDIQIAKQMMTVAKNFCNVDVIKFQKRTPKELLTKEEYDSPHPVTANSFGSSYGQHREFLEFSQKQHRELKQYADKIGVEYSTSVWDLTSAKQIVELSPKKIKIPSACNLKFEILDYLCKNFKGQIHLSLGMTTKVEEKKIIDFFIKKGRNKDLVIYACTSGYPVPFNEVALLEIQRLKKKYGQVIGDVGFSGHHLGFAIDIAAYTLGANFIERHFTLDRTWKGTDHAASLEPDGLRRLVRDLNATFMSLHYKEKEIMNIELEQRKKLKRW
jgi:sialic acid synthase